MEELLASLMSARNTAQLQHWRTSSFAQHLALGEVYELLDKSIDELAELAMGDAGTIIGDVRFDQPSNWNRADPLVFISQLHDALPELKKLLPQLDWLLNEFEVLQAGVARQKYKLEQLK